jgi:cytochrome b involved in lipid metabolism
LAYFIYTNYSESVTNLINRNTSSEPKMEKVKPDRIIVYYKGSKYDVTDFAIHHPGGKDVLLEHNGRDIETAMIDAQHSVNAYKLLEKHLIK